MEIDPYYIRNLCARLPQLEDNERTKLDVKQKWYDLSGQKKRDIEEFCKDLAAMANAPGPDGIIIIGIDEKKGQFIDSPFRHSNLKDTADLQNLVVKKIEKPVHFDIEQVRLDKEQVTISIIKIPRSINKPHTMRTYRKYDKHDKQENLIENHTPIRRGSRIFTANSFDYELMFLDRQSIIPDYNLTFLPIEQGFAYYIKSDKGRHYIALTLRFLIQNIGRNPMAITSTRLVLDSISPRISHANVSFTWTCKAWVVMQTNVIHTPNYYLPYDPIIVPSNELLQLRMEFWSNDLSTDPEDPMLKQWRQELDSLKKFGYAISVSTSNNQTFSSEKWEVDL